MQTLPPALFLVMLELTVGAFFTLYLLDLRGDTSRGYVVFQGALYALFALLTYGAMQAFAARDLLCHIGLCRSDLDAGWLAWQQPLVLAFTLLIVPWNVLLWLAPAPARRGSRRGATPAGAAETGAGSREGAPAEARATAVAVAPVGSGQGIIRARYAVGALTALVGLAAVFAVGMAYRPLASTHLGGAFVVAAFLAGAVALGGVMTAMLLGHWYLNTPTASGKPLEFTTTLLLVGLLAELGFSLLIGPSTAQRLPNATSLPPGTTIQTTGTSVVVTTPTPVPAPAGQPTAPAVPRQPPLDTSAMVWLQYLMGFIAPLGLGAVALWLTRGRSFQSATGMLYLCVAFIFIGEILGRGLLLLPVL
ncbi:MAG: hypothetical protein PVSMB4_14510 [Ktedonobacterales bacterium]